MSWVAEWHNIYISLTSTRKHSYEMNAITLKTVVAQLEGYKPQMGQVTAHHRFTSTHAHNVLYSTKPLWHKSVHELKQESWKANSLHSEWNLTIPETGHTHHCQDNDTKQACPSQINLLHIMISSSNKVMNVPHDHKEQWSMRWVMKLAQWNNEQTPMQDNEHNPLSHQGLSCRPGQ